MQSTHHAINVKDFRIEILNLWWCHNRSARTEHRQLLASTTAVLKDVSKERYYTLRWL
jgi:hypothetical protein